MIGQGQPGSRHGSRLLGRRQPGSRYASRLLWAKAIGGSFAWFADVETSEGNTFTAGTLYWESGSDFVSGAGPEGKCEVTAGGDGENGKVVLSNLAPGDSGHIVWSLKNAGTLTGILTIEAEYTSNENDLLKPEEDAEDNGNDEGELDDWLTFDLSRENGSELCFGAGIQEVIEALNEESQSMEPGSTISYTLNWSVMDEADNTIQSDDLILDVAFTLSQEH